MRDLAMSFEFIIYTEKFAIEHLYYIYVIIWLLIIIAVTSIFVKFKVSKGKT